jgi:hypothetical protein
VLPLLQKNKDEERPSLHPLGVIDHSRNCAGLSSTAELPLLVLFGFENNDFFELLNLFEDKDDLLHLQIFRTVSHVITSLLCEVVQLMPEC